MKIEWILLAEGIGQDARPATTVIGLNQNVLVAPSLPASTKRVVIAHLVADDKPWNPGDKVTVRFSVMSPSSQVIAAQTAQATVVEQAWPGLPASTDLPAELLLTISEYGVHRFEVNVQPPTGEEMKGEVNLYVISPNQPLMDGTEKSE